MRSNLNNSRQNMKVTNFSAPKYEGFQVTRRFKADKSRD
jgi:hypothetical protein